MQLPRLPLALAPPLFALLAVCCSAQSNAPKEHAATPSAGDQIFQQHCAFCHGRDAAGGDTGPDLTRSRLVRSDRSGDSIAPVVREGRLDKGMPRFNLNESQMTDLVQFLHQAAAQATNGGRRGVSDADLTTGNAAQGRAYFHGDGGCTRCHTENGNLAHVASRYTPLELEIRMLYPGNARKTAHVQPAGQPALSGELLYIDDFALILRDDAGKQMHSYPLAGLRYTIDSPVDAHIAQLARYTDDNIHDLLAYLLTLQ